MDSRAHVSPQLSLALELLQPEHLNRCPSLPGSQLSPPPEVSNCSPSVSPHHEAIPTVLPTVAELYSRFRRFNHCFWDGRLPMVRIEYSNRMLAAGSYSPSERLIRIGRKYHEIFPEDVDDTLKHEMIHIFNPTHNADFKRELKRVGSTLRAKCHPSLRRPPRYLYECPGCRQEYPRQRRFRMASCGTCSANGRYDERFKLQLKQSRPPGYQ